MAELAESLFPEVANALTNCFEDRRSTATFEARKG